MTKLTPLGLAEFRSALEDLFATYIADPKDNRTSCGLAHSHIDVHLSRLGAEAVRAVRGLDGADLTVEKASDSEERYVVARVGAFYKGDVVTLRACGPRVVWPYGPPHMHEPCCILFEGGEHCDCKASAADEPDWGLCHAGIGEKEG